MSFSLSGSAKKELSNRGYHQFAVIWGPVVTCLPLLTIFFLVKGFPSVDWSSTLPILIAIMPLMIATEFLWVWGITAGDYSLAVPFASFGPVFGLILGFAVFGEVPATVAMVGLVLVIVGAYLMNAQAALQKGLSIFAPFTEILRSPGPRWILLNALVFSAVGTMQKAGAQHSTPLFFSYLTLAAEFLILTAMIAKKGFGIIRVARKDLWLVAANGLTWTIGFICIYLSFSYTLVAYALGVEQSAILFSVLWGYLFFKEKGFLTRIRAAALMFVGVVLIVLYSN